MLKNSITPTCSGSRSRFTPCSSPRYRPQYNSVQLAPFFKDQGDLVWIVLRKQLALGYADHQSLCNQPLEPSVGVPFLFALSLAFPIRRTRACVKFPS